MIKLRVTPFTSTSRLLVAGAIFLFALLIAAAAFTNGAGRDVREQLTATDAPAHSRLSAAAEIERLLGRGGFSGHLLAYAARTAGDGSAELQQMAALLDEASGQADIFAGLGSEPFARQFVEVTRGRIAQGRLALASMETGVRDPGIVAVEFAADLAAFDNSYARFRAEEQRLTTLDALNVLDLQRWITSLALAAAVFVMGAAAVLLYVNVRKPLRELAEDLQDLLADDEDRAVTGSDRNDEIGMLARAAEELRRTQLQAGRLLTLGSDGALRLRLEGENGRAVDDALEELVTAADMVRSSARDLSTSGADLAQGSCDAMARVEVALTETVDETSGRLAALSDSGEEVLRLAGDLEATRRSLASAERDWRDEMTGLADTMRGEMTSLAETMRDELEHMGATTERLTDMTEAAGTRVEGASGQLTEIAFAWRKEQTALNDASAQARENLTARLVTLDAQIGNLDDTLENLEELTVRAAPPIQEAVNVLGRAVGDMSMASESATAATELMSKEVEATRNARLSVISEAEADRAHWQKDRATIRQQADDMITQMSETANRVEGLAKDLTQSAQDVPGKLDRLSGDLVGLGGQIKTLEQTGGALATQLGGRIVSVHDALSEAREALSDEADTIRGVTSDLKDMHLTFEDESRVVGEQVSSVAETLENLDKHLQAINQRVATPIDLSPVLSALKNEMGQAVTHLTQTIEGQGLNAQASFAEDIERLGERIEGAGESNLVAVDDGFARLSTELETISASQEHGVAQRLSDLSTALDGRIAAQNDASRDIAASLSELADRITSLSDAQDRSDKAASVSHLADRIGELTEAQRKAERALWQTADEALKAEDLSSLIDHRLDALNDSAQAMSDELQALAQTIEMQTAEARDGDTAPQVLEQISRVEHHQGSLGQAQQAIALALHDGLKGIARRLKAADVGPMSEQLDSVVATLVRQQDRLAEVMLEMSTDMGERIDDLAGEIARGNRQARGPRRGFLKKKIDKAQGVDTSTERVAQTQAPQENELSAIYDALRGLTDELKDLSGDEPEDAQSDAPDEVASEEDRKVG